MSRSGTSSSAAMSVAWSRAVYGAGLVDVPARKLELELGAQWPRFGSGAGAGTGPAVGRCGGVGRGRRGGRADGRAAHYSMTSSSKVMVTVSVSAAASPALTVLVSTLLHHALRMLYRLTGAFV